ncbi:phenylalanine--tRNA ligase subunit beta [Fulvivirga sedimenti]|uniref:Phenylalanine--tRNA ligase beta subunit n=1 Tax=Fulvivirga sedimenti TaxID=2879465 RepID=A0A9X1HVR3_9BACT|nr:phenylalanine--tRNA ligase subunit beta [Fulvivirga sedimenti]MCA6077933.1 phenylalanine--tRNA ligase subunit beta [Fulvivirga sedimenti]
MKISLNWLKEYIELDESPEKIGERLTDTGLEVESIETIEAVRGGMQGLVIGEVLQCEPHENADRLKVTMVDIGADEPVQIVCGAPNVDAGQKVVVATVGTMLYPKDGEAFEIRKAKIRGVASAGMICAEDEIGLGESHDGIMVLSTDLDNGTPAANYFNLQDDHIIEIGLTPNRADAASHIGVARDLKAVLHKEVLWPDVSAFPDNISGTPVSVEVLNTEACPRYSGLTLENITVGPSPEWLQNRLRSIGLAPINNIVDITNFVLHETGQPMHAFDADKISGQKVIVQTLPEGTTFTTLDEKERKLAAGDLMICDGGNSGMCIAGVFGGTGSGVKESTRRVFLESAYFSPDYIRKTAQYHKLKTDASFRYERGTDPEITVYALKRAALLMQEIAGATIASEIIDIYPQKIEPKIIEVSYAHIDRLIGIPVPTPTVETILKRLDIQMTDLTDDGFRAVVPPYRVDVTREADIIEEVLRIYGFNQVPLPESLSSDFLAEFDEKSPDKLQRTISDLLVSNGFFEIITNSLTKPAYSADYGVSNPEESVEILNKLSEDLGVMRQSLLFSMLEVAQYNISHKQTELRLFEFGKEYSKHDDKYTERQRLGLIFSGKFLEENWQKTDRDVHFHDLSGVVHLILSRILNASLQQEVVSDPRFSYTLSLRVGKREIARLGMVDSKLSRKFGIRQNVYFADIDWDQVIRISNNSIIFKEVAKFPEVRRDLSLVISKNITFEDIRMLALKNESKILKDVRMFDVYEGDKIESGKKAYALTFTLQDRNRTLDDKVIDKTMNRLMSAFETELNALIRK